MESPKTRQLVKLLEKLGLDEQKVLILTAGHRPAVYLSARNLADVEVQAYGNESAYHVLWADSVVIEEGALAEDESVAEGSAAVAEEGSDE
jgi:ribosomal protein L4